MIPRAVSTCPAVRCLGAVGLRARRTVFSSDLVALGVARRMGAAAPLSSLRRRASTPRAFSTGHGFQREVSE